MRVDIWSDIVCPWCYVGKRRFERALAAFEHRDRIEVVHHSFQLDPSYPAGHTEPTVEMLSRKYGMSVDEAAQMEARLEQTAAGDGLEYHMDGLHIGNTADAHRVVHLARSHGRQDAMVERLFRAHFTEKLSVFSHDSLIALAVEVGLDADEVRSVLESDRYAAEVDEDARAAARLGANGVPFFVIDMRYGVSGAQPTELFTQALTEAWDTSEYARS
ncbi:DsbA family oxidoreductase [Kutzneria kofuensis]|uniref:Putative DsbA family dithiol-disulfide isomerase n=1 Tax=Kutzneria kofuensis TaxID=103725 RepID=A0A7W9KM22_9PSEU|nr:DsbA family oxidoreductase [Kutzneria kofuensis]MBB5895065.1 putative DsbA family dithiol-disulfide isomerase [Kutzneria kofuensis]